MQTRGQHKTGQAARGVAAKDGAAVDQAAPRGMVLATHPGGIAGALCARRGPIWPGGGVLILRTRRSCRPSSKTRHIPRLATRCQCNDAMTVARKTGRTTARLHKTGARMVRRPKRQKTSGCPPWGHLRIGCSLQPATRLPKTCMPPTVTKPRLMTPPSTNLRLLRQGTEKPPAAAAVCRMRSRRGTAIYIPASAGGPPASGVVSVLLEGGGGPWDA